MRKTAEFKKSILFWSLWGAFFAGLMAAPISSFAEGEDEVTFDSSINQESNTYDDALKKEEPKIKEVTEAIPTAAPKTPEDNTLAGLGGLSSFSDIAVISKRFLPKTHRFEIFPNIGMIINDAFFTDFSFGVRAAYSFTEKYSVEFTGLWVGSSNKAVTNELAADSIVATAFATPTAYYGLDFKWSPLYGKLGWMNKSITPFDIYFSGGAGLTSTNQSTMPVTIHVGFGETYALNKWMAIRLDLSWYGYQSSSQVLGVTSTGSYSNIYATAGASFFFPEAEYR